MIQYGNCSNHAMITLSYIIIFYMQECWKSPPKANFGLCHRGFQFFFFRPAADLPTQPLAQHSNADTPLDFSGACGAHRHVNDTMYILSTYIILELILSLKPTMGPCSGQLQKRQSHHTLRHASHRLLKGRRDTVPFRPSVQVTHHKSFWTEHLRYLSWVTPASEHLVKQVIMRFFSAPRAFWMEMGF